MSKNEVIMNEIKGKISKLEDEIFGLNNSKSNIIDKNKGFMINIIFPFIVSLLMTSMMDLILIINSYFSASSVSLINIYFDVVEVYNFLMIVISSICISFGSFISFFNYLDYKKDLEKIKDIDSLLFQLDNDLIKLRNELVENNIRTNEIKKSNDFEFSKVKYFNENLVRYSRVKNNRRILVRKRNLV